MRTKISNLRGLTIYLYPWCNDKTMKKNFTNTKRRDIIVFNNSQMQILNGHIYIQMSRQIPKCPFSQISTNGATAPSKVERLTLLFSFFLSHFLSPISLLSLHFQMAEWPTKYEIGYPVNG